MKNNKDKSIQKVLKQKQHVLDKYGNLTIDELLLNKHDSLLFSFEGTLRPLKIINQRTDGVSIIVPIRTFAD